MVYTVSITSQGQISIPVQIRQALGLSKKGKALVSIHDGRMTVEPVKDFLELGGSLKTNKKPLSPRKMRELFTEHMARQSVGEET